MVPPRMAVACITLLLSMLPIATATVNGQGFLDIDLTGDAVTLNYRLELRENLTTLPLTRVILDSSNSSAVAQPLEAAIQKIVPEARLDISKFKFAAKTELLNANTNMWLIQQNVTAVVGGVTNSLGGMATYRLGLLSMNISDSIRLADVEFNQVGRTYLLQPLLSQPADQTHYFLSTVKYLERFVPEFATTSFKLLDFSWIPDVAQWSHTPQVFATSSTWTFDPATGPRGNPYNLTLGIRPVEDTYLRFLVAVYSPTLELTAPARAWAEGSTISFDLPTQADMAMPFIIAASLVFGFGTYLAEKRLLRHLSLKRGKR